MSGITERLKVAIADRYVIERHLGQGGMATVYLAHDVKHDRKVALKVLRPELAAVIGAERFLQEIKVTANLQHPHILPLHDSGEADSFLFYVMPYVEGDTLRDKIDREKQLGVDDAIDISRSVASALDYAHRQGVIHRDIKPENILLHDGQALVADFGIALAVSAAGGSRLTETGLSIGTPHYMSPEQAMGDRELDARSDVYSLGAMLYELLTGDPPYTGSTAQAIVAKVITEKAPPVTATRDTVPGHVAAAIQKALAKLPADRFTSAAEFATALTTPGFAMPAAIGEGVPAPATGGWRRAFLAATAVAVGLLITTVVSWTRDGSAAGPSVYDVGLPDGAPIQIRAPASLDVAPAGDFVVYIAAVDTNATELWYRSLRDGTARPIAGTRGALRPAISPSGDRVAFFANGRARVVPVAGGESRPLAEALFGDLRWVSETRLMLIDGDGVRLRWLDPEGGESEAVDIGYCINGRVVLDGDRLLCGGGGGKNALLYGIYDSSVVGLGAATDGALGIRGADFRVVDDRYLVYMSVGGDLRATTVDLARAAVGRSVTLAQGIRRTEYFGTGQFAIGASGTLVYALGENAEVGPLVTYRPGQPLDTLPVEPAAFLRYDISADGRWLAAVVEGVTEQELRVYDLATGQQQTWLSAQGVGAPFWSPDGTLLATSLFPDSSIVIGSPSSSAPPATLLEHTEQGLAGFLADGRIVLTDWGLATVAVLTRSGTSVAVDTLVQDAVFPEFSPDGSWIAYNSKDLSRLWLTPVSELSRRFQVQVDVEDAQWLSDSQFLYTDYAARATFYVVDVDPSASPPVGEPRFYHVDPAMTGTPGRSYTITSDGGLVYVRGPARGTGTYLRVVPGWVEQMKRAVDEANR